MSAIKKLFAGALLATSAITASAATFDLGTLDSKASVIGNAVSGPFFFDTYKFTLATDGLVNGSAFSFEFGRLLGASGFTVLLQDASLTTIGSDTLPSDGFSFSNLAAGSYALSFLGFPTGAAGGIYAGVLNSVSAVPEPASYAMLLAGLAGVGFVSARRRKQD